MKLHEKDLNTPSFHRAHYEEIMLTIAVVNSFVCTKAFHMSYFVQSYVRLLHLCLWGLTSTKIQQFIYK